MGRIGVTVSLVGESLTPTNKTLIRTYDMPFGGLCEGRGRRRERETGCPNGEVSSFTFARVPEIVWSVRRLRCTTLEVVFPKLPRSRSKMFDLRPRSLPKRQLVQYSWPTRITVVFAAYPVRMEPGY